MLIAGPASRKRGVRINRVNYGGMLSGFIDIMAQHLYTRVPLFVTHKNENAYEVMLEQSDARAALYIDLKISGMK